MKQFENILIRIIEIIFTSILFVMLVLIVTQVGLRYVLNQSIVGANELATILFAYTSALGIAVAIAKREHIAISWFVEKLKPSHRKVLDVVCLILLAMINIVIFCYSIKWINATGFRMISVLQVPRWTSQIAIPIGTGFSAIFCFIKLYLGLKGKEEFGISWTQEN